MIIEDISITCEEKFLKTVELIIIYYIYDDECQIYFIIFVSLVLQYIISYDM